MSVAAPGTALRFLASCLLVPMALLSSGCAMLPFGKDENKDPAASVPQGPRQQVYRLEIDAPDELRTLLANYLDLARFENAPANEGIDATELARLVAAAPAQARALLETEGYFNAEVLPERVPSADGPTLVRLLVQPGPRTTIASLKVETTGALRQAAAQPGSDGARLLESLRRDFALQPGAPFRQADWTAAKTATLARLRAQGYPAANWETTAAQVDAAEHRVTLELLADSGPLFRVGDLKIEGLQRHDESTVRRLATFPRGEPYSEKLLLDYQERLQKLGLFEGAVVEIDPDPASADAAPVTVRVRELPLQQATVGVGYSANTGERFTLEHFHRKPFGIPWTAKNKFEIGSELKNWSGELISHPLDGLYRNLVAGQAERLRSGDEVRTAWSARVGRTQDTPRIERLYFLEYVNARVDNVAGTTRNSAVSLNYHWVYRDLDSVLLPTDGYTLSAQAAVGQARSDTAADGPFGRAYGRLTWYKPLGQSWYAMTRLELGQVFAQDAVGVPDTILFRAGGDDSVRGYAYRTLGPVVDGAVTSGRMMLTSSLEIARPISKKYPQFWWAAFLDAGNAANRWSEIDPALGYGLGLRWRSPVGPLRLDLAYGQEVRRWRMHLSVGIAF